MILVISHEQDPHAERVMGLLSGAGKPALLLDLAELPVRACLSIEYGGRNAPAILYTRASGDTFSLNEVQSVWWRRPQVPDLSQVTDPQVNLFTANEWSEAINGLWHLLEARWMNDPVRDDAASRKARQLHVAAQAGLKVPRTLITSDPARARSFVERLGMGHVVYKTFSCTHAIWRETRLLRPDDLGLIEAVRVAPVIFQEFIPAECDLRITAVGGQYFPAAIRSGQSEDRIDFRMAVGNASVQAEALPDAVTRKLDALMERLGLVYGAIDMRRTPDGEYYFFEVNTAGEFLFIEDRTLQPISGRIAEWLAETTRSS